MPVQNKTNQVLRQPVLMHPDYRSLREYQRGLNAGFSLLDNAMKGFYRSDKFMECVSTAGAELQRMNGKIDSDLYQISHYLKSDMKMNRAFDEQINKLLKPIRKQLGSYPASIQEQLRKGMRTLMEEENDDSSNTRRKTRG